jgi:hypothetical protein
VAGVPAREIGKADEYLRKRALYEQMGLVKRDI